MMKKMSLKISLAILVSAALFSVNSSVAESLSERIAGIEPIIGSYPPDIKTEGELREVQSKYLSIKSELDAKLAAQPGNQELLFMRGHLQSMGHNFDYPDAWQGATDDFRAVLDANPNNVSALLDLGRLWVNSRPDLAVNAEGIFRGAQCFHGKEPLEEAQRGIFFALFYQGKMQEAFRQSEYLKKTWPQEERYQKLNEMIRAKLAPSQHADEVTTEQLVMASCNK